MTHKPVPSDGIIRQLTREYVTRERPDLLPRWRELRGDDEESKPTLPPETKKRQEAARKGHARRRMKEAARKGHARRRMKYTDARLETLEYALRGAIQTAAPIMSGEIKEDLLGLVVQERTRLAEKTEHESKLETL